MTQPAAAVSIRSRQVRCLEECDLEITSTDEPGVMLISYAIGKGATPTIRLSMPDLMRAVTRVDMNSTCTDAETWSIRSAKRPGHLILRLYHVDHKPVDGTLNTADLLDAVVFIITGTGGNQSAAATVPVR